MNEYQKEAHHKRTVLKGIFEAFLKPLANSYQGYSRVEPLTLFDVLYELMGRDRFIKHFEATEEINYIGTCKIKKGWHVLVRYDRTMLDELGIDLWAGRTLGAGFDKGDEVTGRVTAEEYRDYILPKLRELHVKKRENT